MSHKDYFISFGAGLVAALMTLGLSILSPITFLLAYFIPLPFFISALVYGFYGTVIASTSGSVLVAIFYGPSAAIGFLIMNACPALWHAKQNITNENQKNIGKIISEISFAGIILFLISSIFFSEKIISFADTFNNHIINNFDHKIAIPTTILNLFPSLIISSWITILILNLIISKKIINNFKISSHVNSYEFVKTSLPRWIVYLFIIFLIFSVILKDIYGIWAQSMTLILSVPITLQGLAIIQFKLIKLTSGKFLTGLFYIIVLFIPFMLAIIAAIGVLDHFYNFRNLNLNNDILSRGDK